MQTYRVFRASRLKLSALLLSGSTVLMSIALLSSSTSAQAQAGAAANFPE